MDKQLVIIAGFCGGIGKAFFNYYMRQPSTECIGIGRKCEPSKNQIALDLADEEKAREIITNMDLEKYTKAVYLHGIGIDLFEPDGRPEMDYDQDGIDDRIYESNVQTLMNAAKPLMRMVAEKNKRLTLCAIGSISDHFKVPLWQSFSRSKDIVRTFFKSTSNQYLNNVMINVSSVLCDDNKYARKFADTTHWLKPEQIIEISTPILDRDLKAKYIEFDIFNPSPDYRQDYFTNIPRLFEQWRQDMGYAKGERIPHGLRI